MGVAQRSFTQAVLLQLPNPDAALKILVIDENPSRDVLDQMFQVSRVLRRPIATFVDRSDKAEIEAAIDAGVSAYIVDGSQEGARQAAPRHDDFALQRPPSPARRAR